MLFEGVVPALLTPFDENGRVDTDALADTADGLIEDGATGLVGTGTMGEAQSLSAAERRLVIETLVEAAAGRVRVTAGVSSETAAASLELASDAARAGAGALMLLPSLGYGGDAREIESFYATVAGGAGLPVMAYNNPKASGTDMAPALISRLAEIEGVAAVKECSGDARRIADILDAVGERLEVLVGGDDWALEGFCAGATGWVSGVANIAPRECVELYRLCRDGRLDDARAVYGRLLPLARLDMKPKLVQYFKAAMDLVGRAGGPCRPPRLELTAEERHEVEAAVRAMGVGVAP
jgi:4-hydroxy-tetrahydrodipicolinate synthase